MTIEVGRSSGGGFSNFLEFTASDTFVVPNGIFSLRVLVQGGGGNGGNGTNTASGGGGGAGGNTLMGIMQVAPAETLTLTVGAAAGDSYIEKGTVVAAISNGGGSGGTATGGGSEGALNPMTLMSGSVIRGRNGGNGSGGANRPLSFRGSSRIGFRFLR